MKLFFLDNEYTDYVVMAADLTEAWYKLGQQVNIARPDTSEATMVDEGWAEYVGWSVAYHQMYEVPKSGFSYDSSHQTVIVY
jgi:hypothetical protein